MTANAFAERWVGALRGECLDRIWIVNRHQLEHLLDVYTVQYNRDRPHRSFPLGRPTNRHQRLPAVRDGISADAD
jgi:transposase InsO family protein